MYERKTETARGKIKAMTRTIFPDDKSVFQNPGFSFQILKCSEISYSKILTSYKIVRNSKG